MKTSRIATAILTVLLLGGAAIGGVFALGADAPSPVERQARNGADLVPTAEQSAKDGAARGGRALLSNLPLHFVENRGQEDPQVAYYLRGRDTSVYFTRSGLTFALTSPGPGAGTNRETGDRSSLRPSVRTVAVTPDAVEAQRWAVKLDFVGANAVTPRGAESMPAVISHWTGGERQGPTGLKTYRSVVYPELWPGIDLVYTGDAGQLKYTFLVKPGADPSRIRLAYQGASSVTLTDAGRLAIATPAGGFTDDRPYAYQEDHGARREVPAAYALSPASDGVHGYGFAVGSYDRTRTLVLDPSVLIYAGFIGGSGNDEATAIAIDRDGNAYVAGITDSPVPSFPTAVGPDPIFNGGRKDAFVAKVSADGTTLLYAGYLGGAGDDRAFGIAVDRAGNAYVTGITDSDQTTFPVKVGPSLSHGGGADAFVAKVRADGTALEYCGYIGGSKREEGIAIAVNAAGNAYVGGFTTSDQATFPVRVGPDLTFGGDGDAFVAKVKADGTALAYAGYIGGALEDYAMGIAVDAGGNAYVTGGTESDQRSFPVKVGPDLVHNGSFTDAFVAKVRADGTSLIYAGYIGGAGFDEGTAIAVDGAGQAYVAGFTFSDEDTFPVKGGPETAHSGKSDAFVAKVKADGTTLLYAGYLGGALNDQASGIAVDAAGNAYITGSTESDETTFPVKAGPVIFYSGGGDAFVAKVKADGAGLLYAGYLGGRASDAGRAIAVDGAGDVYLAGRTLSDQAGFPVTAGPDPIHGGAADAFVAKLSGKADLREVSVSFSEPAVKPGASFVVRAFAFNGSLGTSKPSTTRFYLSTDGIKSADDILLGGSRAVPSLPPGTFNGGNTTVTVPASTPTGSYHVLSCADDARAVVEVDEANNCDLSVLMQVTLPDLVETSAFVLVLSAPPGGSFSVTDTVKNLSPVSAPASTTRYYLSIDPAKGAGDILLTGSRAVGALAPSGASGGSATVTVPAATAPGSYHLLVCADDTNLVKEISENNCRVAVQFTVRRVSPPAL